MTEDENRSPILVGRERGSDAFVAVFPPAYEGKLGVMTARLEYDDANPKNAGFGERAYYTGTLTVDGTEVFAFDDIGSPIDGLAVDSEEAYRKVLPAVVSFGSAFEGSGHGEVCNSNEVAHEHSTVFDLARFSLDEDPQFVEAALPIVFPSRTDIFRDRSTIENASATQIEVIGQLTNGKIVGKSGAALEVVNPKAFDAVPQDGETYAIARGLDGQDRAVQQREHALER